MEGNIEHRVDGYISIVMFDETPGEELFIWMTEDYNSDLKPSQQADQYKTITRTQLDHELIRKLGRPGSGKQSVEKRNTMIGAIKDYGGVNLNPENGNFKGFFNHKASPVRQLIDDKIISLTKK